MTNEGFKRFKPPVTESPRWAEIFKRREERSKYAEIKVDDPNYIPEIDRVKKVETIVDSQVEVVQQIVSEQQRLESLIYDTAKDWLFHHEVLPPFDTFDVNSRFDSFLVSFSQEYYDGIKTIEFSNRVRPPAYARVNTDLSISIINPGKRIFFIDSQVKAKYLPDLKTMPDYQIKDTELSEILEALAQISDRLERKT